MRKAAALLFGVLVTGLTLSTGSAPVGAAPLSLAPVADAFVSSGQPSASYGATRDLRTGDDPTDGSTYRAFLKFDIPELDGKVAKMRLRIFVSDGSTEGVVVSLARSGWSEDTVTWSDAPALGATLTTERTRTGDSWLDLRLDPEDVDRAGTVTLALTGPENLVRLASRESAHPPELVLQVAAAEPQATPTAETTEPPDPTPQPEPSATTGPAPTTTTGPAPTTAPTQAPTPGPTSIATPPPGGASVPAIPIGYGDLLRKSFSDGRLAPFRTLTYPNDHPGDLMVEYGRYVTDAEHISVHDGYLDLRATRNADGSWDQAFVGTGLTGDGSPATFQFQYGTARAMARMNNGPGAWQSLWYLVANSWGAAEIDWAELIGGRLTANIHGTSNDGQKASIPAFRADEWHEYGITKTPTYIAFLLDGREIARANVAMTAPMALLADAKVGLTPPDQTTPSTLFLHVAWWTVDPLP